MSRTTPFLRRASKKKVHNHKMNHNNLEATKDKKLRQFTLPDKSDSMDQQPSNYIRSQKIKETSLLLKI
jgi:hypothetical protein